MDQDFYINILRQLKSLHELKIIDEKEKRYLKRLVLNQSNSFEMNINQEEIMKTLLNEIHIYRRAQQKLTSSDRYLIIIAEETDEELES